MAMSCSSKSPDTSSMPGNDTPKTQQTVEEDDFTTSSSDEDEMDQELLEIKIKETQRKLEIRSKQELTIDTGIQELTEQRKLHEQEDKDWDLKVKTLQATLAEKRKLIEGLKVNHKLATEKHDKVLARSNFLKGRIQDLDVQKKGLLKSLESLQERLGRAEEETSFGNAEKAQLELVRLTREKKELEENLEKANERVSELEAEVEETENVSKTLEKQATLREKQFKELQDLKENDYRRDLRDLRAEQIAAKKRLQDAKDILTQTILETEAYKLELKQAERTLEAEKLAVEEAHKETKEIKDEKIELRKRCKSLAMDLKAQMQADGFSVNMIKAKSTEKGGDQTNDQRLDELKVIIEAIQKQNKLLKKELSRKTTSLAEALLSLEGQHVMPRYQRKLKKRWDKFSASIEDTVSSGWSKLGNMVESEKTQPETEKTSEDSGTEDEPEDTKQETPTSTPATEQEVLEPAPAAASTLKIICSWFNKSGNAVAANLPKNAESDNCPSSSADIDNDAFAVSTNPFDDDFKPQDYSDNMFHISEHLNQRP